MKTASMTSGRLAKLVAGFSEAKVAVIGDFVLDKYYDLDPARQKVSVESGKAAHQVVGIRHAAGCAGTIVNNLASLGCARIMAIGFCGDDGDGYELSRDLQSVGCDITHLHKTARRVTPLYLKPRDVNDDTLSGELERFDISNGSPTPPEVEDALIASLDAVLGEVDVISIMDQIDSPNHGVVTDRVRSAIAERAAACPGTIFWADSRRFIRHFRNVIIKPNPFELLGIDNPPPGTQFDDQELLNMARKHRQDYQTPLVLTRGAAGMWVSDPEWTEVPGVRIKGPVDSTGAGDSATAGAISALSAGASLVEAAVVANLVASITVQQIGKTGTARVDQLKAARQAWIGKR
ncbi:MAG: bifunctional heptose 7-phosphate kinase/heptose 1-phosphate adenyltransferase [Puniceicoccaceae bacterium]